MSFTEVFKEYLLKEIVKLIDSVPLSKDDVKEVLKYILDHIE